MQTALTYRTNRDLFSNYYLDEHLPETEEWDEVSEDELQEAYDDVMDLWEREKDTAPKRNESQLEEKFIRPMFRKLGIPFEVEESTDRTQRRPDYGFFETEKTARGAFERREEGGDFYENAVAVADAKRWGRPLDTRGSGEHERDFENPSYQIHVYLQETPARWAVLTDGKKWRLYYGPTSHRLDSYYEVDLPTILEKGDLEDFKYFYLFFRHEAFLEDTGGDSFLDDVYGESNVFAKELGEDLQDNIYEAIKVLSEGFLQYPDNDLDDEDLGLIHDSSLIYLYRLIFVLYAEAEGRELLDTSNEIYEESYSLNSLKQEVAEEIDSGNPKYRDWQDNLQSRLDELFMLIDQGSKPRGIPEEDLYIPAYNGGLFRTDPDEDDSEEARFLANHDVGDAYLARVVELLTRSRNGNGGGKIFVDYSSLDVRHLGSIYEGLLEYKLNIADEPLALDDGEYMSADEGDDVIVQEGEVYLTTGSGERKATGSYYTPEYVVEYIVENTLEPLVDDIRADLAGRSARGEDRGFAEEFAERIFDLKILDPAMGSGHFLTSAIDYLAREIIDAQEKQAAQQGNKPVDDEHDINWARRQVAQRCIYGVDLNPLAVELAKVSLWLRTLAAEQPLAFLDHHLKTGNSLVGSDIEEIDKLDSDRGGRDGNTTLADFGVVRKGTIEQLMNIYTEFISIENKDLTDVKEIEHKYDEFERNQLRRRLEAIANVASSELFGVDSIPSNSYERMVSALETDEEWRRIEQQEWFKTSQQMADKKHYFHWKIEFPEVFYQEDGNVKTDPGFDAVIGNPPYITFGGRWTGKVEEGFDEAMRLQFPETAEYKLNTYSLFIQRGREVLGQQKRMSYIIPDSFLTGSYFQNLREYILDHTSVSELFLLAYDVWDAGDVGYSVVFELTNETATNNSVKLKRATGRETFESPEKFEMNQETFQSYPEKKLYLFFSEDEFSIFNNIWKNSRQLGDVVDFYTGLRSRTSKNEMTSNTKRGKNWKKGLSVGKDVRRYVIWGDPVYIEIDEEKLYGGYDLEKYEDEKIFMRKTGDKIIASRDTDGLVAFDNLHTINIEDENYSTEVILAILNSGLIEYYYNLTSSSKGRVLPQLNIESLEKLPVPSDLSVEITKDIQSNVQKIELKKSNFRTEAKGFLSWISREWGCELDELSLKTHLREYWEYDFKEMLRVAKKNSSLVDGDPTSREFQERLEREWKTSVEKLVDIELEIENIDSEIERNVCKLYGLTSDQIATINAKMGDEK